MPIIDFKAGPTKLDVVIDAPAQPTSVQFMLMDGSLVDAAYVGSSGNLYTYEYLTDASDGVYTVIVDSGLSTEEQATIANQNTASNCLLK